MNAVIRQGLFDRWYLFDPGNQQRAWSGARWVACTAMGMPTASIQVCNFDSFEEAAEYAAQIPEFETRAENE